MSGAVCIGGRSVSDRYSNRVHSRVSSSISYECGAKIVPCPKKFGLMDFEMDLLFERVNMRGEVDVESFRNH